jgi:protein-disulfide isomerase
MHLLRLGPVLLALVATSQSTCRGSGNSSTAASGGAAPAADVELSGVDTGSLTPRERREWSSYVSELLAPCPDQPVSVAQCVKESRKCAKCLPAAKLLLKQVREGRSRSQAEDAFYSRFSPDRVKSIDLADTPSKGPASAPVTIVEFADFECPHCRHAAPMLEKLVEQYPGKVRLLFKCYPLNAHPHGEQAARAVVAAGMQGKFWEMHHAVFEHQEALEPRDLEKYAKDIGLDVAKWKADFESEAVADRVARDRKQGDALGITGTPTMFINAREFDLAKFDMTDDLDDWIKLEIELADGGAPAPVPAASPAIRAADKK